MSQNKGLIIIIIVIKILINSLLKFLNQKINTSN